jgi:murein DD-endopeptidase MepM/ murein hydrolase activator NlpD
MTAHPTRTLALKSLLPVLGLSLALGGAAWANVMIDSASTPPPAAPAPVAAAPEPTTQVLVWSGADVDGDGQADFANPTGKAVRACDGYGCGGFGSERDGGGRRHQGVDYDATAGQAVLAPISGFVSKIGEAYAGDSRYHFVEISNPALHYQARVFYVDPSVGEGDAVRLGQTIGHARSLQPRYPGITNHVHLEINKAGGRKIDSVRVITAHLETVPASGRNPLASQG